MGVLETSLTCLKLSLCVKNFPALSLNNRTQRIAVLGGKFFTSLFNSSIDILSIYSNSNLSLYFGKTWFISLLTA